MFLGVENIAKSYGSAHVVDAVSFGVNKGELVSIIGPSGAGKTTLLKILAGLEKADQGAITSMADLQNNPAILVFQDYLLFPTMTIFDNIAFGLRCRKIARAEIGKKVIEMLEYFQLKDKSAHYPGQLSAGQQQRVALARAMVVSPSILLLDEPFANLDRNLKAETAEFIREFQQEYQITTISVTHDLQEAFMMSDKIGIMLEGRLCQFDDVKTVYNQPVSSQVAEFLGHVNIIPPHCFNYLELEESGPANGSSISVRAEALELSREGECLWRIDEVVFAGQFIMYRVSLEKTALTVYSFNGDFGQGERVSVRVKQFIKIKES
ncbi:MAG: ABC transporter ATP-binding protein [Desulfocapsaceae bacterium]|nr:ABC transporter ATP-binding protein [Desulfocapsaceae bacterium]